MEPRIFTYALSTDTLLESLASWRSKRRSGIGKKNYRMKRDDADNKIELYITGGILPLFIVFENKVDVQQLKISGQATVPWWMIFAPLVFLSGPVLRGGISNFPSILAEVCALVILGLLIYAMQQRVMRKLLKQIIQELSLAEIT